MRNDGRKRIPIQVAEAVERVMKYAKHGEVEEISITESYGEFSGKMLSQIMTFLILIVPYDGFAIRAEDTKEATQENPVEFEVIGEIGAGSVFRGSRSF